MLQKGSMVTTKRELKLLQKGNIKIDLLQKGNIFEPDMTKIILTDKIH